jgi:hypothetical protein
MFKSSVVLSLIESVESVLKTDRLAVVSCVRGKEKNLPKGANSEFVTVVVVHMLANSS